MRTSQMRVALLGTAIGALCIIVGYSDERMRLLAKSGRKSQFYYSPLFREFPLRFHAARFPKVAARWKPKKKGRRARRERMWLTPRSNRAFAGFLHPETTATKENRRNRSTRRPVRVNGAVPSSAPASRFVIFFLRPAR